MAGELTFNPFTKKLDVIGDVAGLESLKLDQTTQQTVINGAPIFDKGIIIKSGEKLVLDG
jgi:hypothetical protein